MPQVDRPELFRVHPDAPPPPAVDEGIHSWPIGSFAPMAFYRPAPIVDFTRTVLVQFLLGFVLHAVLAPAPGIVTIAACALLAIGLARRAFVRWLVGASTRWKVATVAAVMLNLAFVSLVTLARGCGPGDLATGLALAPVERTAAGEGCQPAIEDLMIGYRELP